MIITSMTYMDLTGLGTDGNIYIRQESDSDYEHSSRMKSCTLGLFLSSL